MHALRVAISIDEYCGDDGPHPSKEIVIPGYGVRVSKDVRDQPITDHARNRQYGAADDDFASLGRDSMWGVCVLFLYPRHECSRPQQSAVLSVCLLRFERVRHVLWPDPFVELFRGQ